MSKPNDRTIRNLTASESEAVKSNLNWSFINRIFCSSFIKQIKKGNMDSINPIAAFVQIAKETTPRQIHIPKHASELKIGTGLHCLFGDENGQVEHCYLTALYAALYPYIKYSSGKRVAAQSFDDILNDLPNLERTVSPYLEQVRQSKPNDSVMHELLLESSDRIVLVAHIFAFKSIILTEGYYYKPLSPVVQHAVKDGRVELKLENGARESLKINGDVAESKIINLIKTKFNLHHKLETKPKKVYMNEDSYKGLVEGEKDLATSVELLDGSCVVNFDGDKAPLEFTIDLDPNDPDPEKTYNAIIENIKSNFIFADEVKN